MLLRLDTKVPGRIPDERWPVSRERLRDSVPSAGKGLRQDFGEAVHFGRKLVVMVGGWWQVASGDGRRRGACETKGEKKRFGGERGGIYINETIVTVLGCLRCLVGSLMVLVIIVL